MRQRETQRDRILALLKEREGHWVPLYEITALAAQYNTRVLELRRAGHIIENRTEHRDGVVHSWFRIVPPKGQRTMFDTTPGADAQAETSHPQGLFRPEELHPPGHFGHRDYGR